MEKIKTVFIVPHCCRTSTYIMDESGVGNFRRRRNLITVVVIEVCPYGVFERAIDIAGTSNILATGFVFVGRCWMLLICEFLKFVSFSA